MIQDRAIRSILDSRGYFPNRVMKKDNNFHSRAKNSGSSG